MLGNHLNLQEIAKMRTKAYIEQELIEAEQLRDHYTEEVHALREELKTLNNPEAKK